MRTDSPAFEYYRATHGRWRGAYRLQITDWSGFQAAPITPMDRVRLLLMHLLPKLVGPFTLTTTMDASRIEQGEVLHTTKTTKWGAPLFLSEETLYLERDGRSLRMRGPQRLWPLFWPARSFGDAHVEVDADARGATYRIPWIGGELLQRTTVVPGGVDLSQQNAWLLAEVRLRRHGESTPLAQAPTGFEAGRHAREAAFNGR